jgi:hypothetical protein
MRRTVESKAREEPEQGSDERWNIPARQPSVSCLLSCISFLRAFAPLREAY